VEVLIVNHEEVAQLLPMEECMDAMAEALSALARGEALMPLRTVMRLPEGIGGLAAMPSYLGGVDAIGIKVISVFPGNWGTEYDSHQGAVMLFDARQGQLLAIADATEITAIRTAAVSGVATKALAREDAGDLAILGSGTQARTHLEAMSAARPIRRVRVWSRSPQNAERFVQAANRHGIAVESMPSAEQAVAGADLICTTTSATEPILLGRWISPGAHINAVGAAFPTARELDAEAVVRSRLFVDRRESALNEAGDFLIARQEGAVDERHILGELGEVLTGDIRGRTGGDDITLFESLGLAVEDLASIHHIYRRAMETGTGTRVRLGGRRQVAP
jgi:ornithine cyclodeaminase/alanine dehydrogenase-like protein (mu-crystallin family)